LVVRSEEKFGLRLCIRCSPLSEDESEGADLTALYIVLDVGLDRRKVTKNQNLTNLFSRKNLIETLDRLVSREQGGLEEGAVGQIDRPILSSREELIASERIIVFR
jgi:hypothetical protein